MVQDSQGKHILVGHRLVIQQPIHSHCLLALCALCKWEDVVAILSSLPIGLELNRGVIVPAMILLLKPRQILIHQVKPLLDIIISIKEDLAVGRMVVFCMKCFELFECEIGNNSWVAARINSVSVVRKQCLLGLSV
jgi:hypothetical protein